MIDGINLIIANRLGDALPVERITAQQLEIKIDVAIADMFSQICFRNNNIADAEAKTAQKFYFALNLKNYLEEIKENVDRTAN